MNNKEIIWLNYDVLSGRINNIFSSCYKIDRYYDSSVNAPNCSGIMINQYVQVYKKIETIMKNYRKLLEKDLFDFLQAGALLAQADANAAENFKKGTK